MKQELMRLREEIERQVKDLRERKDRAMAIAARSSLSSDLGQRAVDLEGVTTESLAVRHLIDKLCAILQDQTT